MAGLLTKFKNIVFGGGDEASIDDLLSKIDDFESEEVKLYWKDPMMGTLISVFRTARATFQYNEKTERFGVLLENTDDDDDVDDPEQFLPITKTMKWEIYSPESDNDKYACGHVFNYSGKKEKGVGNGIFQVEFTEDEKTTTIDQFENLVNDILDFIEKNVSKFKLTL